MTAAALLLAPTPGYGECPSCAPQCAGCPDCDGTGYGDRGVQVCANVEIAEADLREPLITIGYARSQMQAAVRSGENEHLLAEAAKSLRDAARRIEEVAMRMERTAGR